MDNNKLLNSLLSSTKISSIDEIIEPSTKISSIDEIRNSKTTTHINTTINHAMSVQSTVKMNDINNKQKESNNVLDLDLTKLSTVIASAVTTENLITTLRLPPFTPLDINSGYTPSQHNSLTLHTLYHY